MGKETPKKEMDNKRIFMTSHMTHSSASFFTFSNYFIIKVCSNVHPQSHVHQYVTMLKLYSQSKVLSNGNVIYIDLLQGVREGTMGN